MMIFLAGSLPPPLNGMSSVTKQVSCLLKERVDVVEASIGPGRFRGIKGHFHKLKNILSAIIALIGVIFAGCKVVYICAEDGLGGLWNIALASIARAMGLKIYIHYHSFYYVEQTTLLMSLLTMIAGRKASHIVLCERMSAGMRSRYPAITHTMIVPNTVSLPTSNPEIIPHDGVITVGMLSNLTLEKGVAEFLHVVTRAIKQGAHVRALLAGPADPKAEEVIRSATDQFVEIRWLGPLAGSEKDKFFRQIDLFLFLTKYRTEAYPLVVVEALAHGVPVIATNKGCLPSFSDLVSCQIIDVADDYTTQAFQRLLALSAGNHLLDEMKIRARAEGKELVSANSELMRACIEEITAAAIAAS